MPQARVDRQRQHAAYRVTMQCYHAAFGAEFSTWTFKKTREDMWQAGEGFCVISICSVLTNCPAKISQPGWRDLKALPE